MGNAQSVWDIPGEWFIGSVNTERLVIGRERALVIDNTVSPPAITVNGVPLSFDFFMAQALMPGDNAGVAAGAAIAFPTDGGSRGVSITRFGPSSLTMAAGGLYEVSWDVSVSEAAQLALWLDAGTISDGTVAGNPILRTVVGRAALIRQMTGKVLIKAVTNATISLRNVSAGAITITANAGGADPVSASLFVRRVG